MILQEGTPGLRRRPAAAQHVLAHAALPDVEAEFEQLTVDAGCTPTGILPAHLADQISDLAGNERSSGLAPSHLRGPEPAKAGAMPGNDGFEFDMASAERQSLQMRENQTHNKRSQGVNFGRFLADR